MVGNPEKDAQMLRENSPALNAERIKTPLLVVQGANDPRVNINESNQMVDALRKRGVHVDYMVKDNEGHGFHNEETASISTARWRNSSANTSRASNPRAKSSPKTAEGKPYATPNP